MRPPSEAGGPPLELLRRRLSMISGERQTVRADAAVNRVLELLSEENFATEAGKTGMSGVIELECGVLEQVWEDPRVFNRRNQLERQGVTIECVPVESSVAGRDFHRCRLRVTF